MRDVTPAYSKKNHPKSFHEAFLPMLAVLAWQIILHNEKTYVKCKCLVFITICLYTNFE